MLTLTSTFRVHFGTGRTEKQTICHKSSDFQNFRVWGFCVFLLIQSFLTTDSLSSPRTLCLSHSAPWAPRMEVLPGLQDLPPTEKMVSSRSTSWCCWWSLQGLVLNLKILLHLDVTQRLTNVTRTQSVLKFHGKQKGRTLLLSLGKAETQQGGDVSLLECDHQNFKL